MKKNFISLAALALCCSLNTYAQYSGGSGTADDPYQIATAEDLQNVSNNPNAYFKQTEDIDLDGVAFTPISTFTGQYDGGMHVIDNLTMESGGNGLGLFSRVNTPGVLENIIITNASVSGGQWIGILCSTNGNWEKVGGTFKNCYIYDSAIDGTESVAAFAGVAGGSFEGCHAYNVTVEGTGTLIGGISGDNENGGHYYDCTFFGDVIGDNEVGGIVGFYNGSCSADVTIKNCAVYGSVTVASSAGGALLGTTNWNTNKFAIENSCSAANVSGPKSGGLAGLDAHLWSMNRVYCTGKVTGKGDSFCGGLFSNVPYNTAYTATDGYYAGELSNSGTGFTGAITGYFCGEGMSNMYYDNALGISGDGSGDGKTTGLDNMKTLANYTFSDASKWQNIDGQTTPFFANQTAPTTITECTTKRISGTCTSSNSSVYLYGSLTGSIWSEYINYNADETKWYIDLNEDDVIEGETVSVIMIDEGKMPSMIAKAKVVEGDESAINTTEASKEVKVVATYNTAGQRTSATQKGISIVKMSNGKAKKVLK